ncbi:MAG: hypothetical protein NTZ26_02520 [Candidatus Aminicenantes bacterium]|nr:hypothetical protein [Candidatus Aminicenantes bacterium]
MILRKTCTLSGRGRRPSGNNDRGDRLRRAAAIGVLGAILGLAAVPGLRAEAPTDFNKLVGKPAELSPWAYAYRADLKTQDKPESAFILRRLERLDRVYRPVSLLLAQGSGKKGEPWPKVEGDWQLLPAKTVRERGELNPAPLGALQAALLWEGRMRLNRVELQWPAALRPPPAASVELRVYPSPYGWFGWQSDLPVTAPPEISGDGSTWTYRGDWTDVDMIAVFVPAAAADAPRPVPAIRAYGPENWKQMDLEIEWGFQAGTEKQVYDGRVEGFFGLVGSVAPLPGDAGTAKDGDAGWTSRSEDSRRRGVSLAVLYIQPAIEMVKNLPRYPSGQPRDTRLTIWTKSGSMTFLVNDLEKGPIYAPEYGFFAARAGARTTGRAFAAKLAASSVRSVREMTRARREVTWEEAMAEIKKPLLPPGTPFPPYKPVPDPPMQVEVPEKRWTDAWRTGSWHLKSGELTYMDLALEAPRPIRAMDTAGLHETAAGWLDGFLKRSGTVADGDFVDGSGNFCLGKLFHETAVFDNPGYETYELVHNGGTGRILYDLAEHFFLTGDTAWFKANQWRMQAAAEWIIRQRTQYLNGWPGRENLLVAGLQPPQHIADCAWGQSEWKWYVNVEAWYCQGLGRFAQAMAEVDPGLAGRYREEAEKYREALRKAVDRAITLAPVMQVRNGTYRSYIPPIFYVRGPSIGQVVQIAMTDDDWPLTMADAVGIPAADDIRLDGHLDVCEDVLALRPTYLFSGNRFQHLAGKRRDLGRPQAEDWFWGGESPQLGYSFLANVYLRRDEIPSFLRQWVNNYAAFVMPTPEYGFLEHFMNNADPSQVEAFQKGEFRKYRNGHALSYFMEQFRSLLVWEDGDVLWLAKATPRHWLAQGLTISVKNAPTDFGPVAYRIVSDVDHGRITAVVEPPTRRASASVWLRLRHPRGAPIKSVKLNGKPWSDFDAAKEIIRWRGLPGPVTIEAQY